MNGWFAAGIKMKRLFHSRSILTLVDSKGVAVLTLVFGLLFPAHAFGTTDEDRTLTPIPMVSGQPAYSPLESLDKGRKLGLLLDYVEKQAPGWAPGLREAMRAPLNWTRNGLQSLGLGDDDDEEGFFAPMREFLQAPAPDVAQAFWMTPGYHHKGFLHDAMMASFNLRQRFFNGQMQLDLRPFYGQNWMSFNGYGGAELGINLSRENTKQPWGRIVLRYTEGDQSLMDHGHGIDMHAEFRFDDHLSLHAGLRENEDTQLGNYVLLRWKVVDFGR